MSKANVLVVEDESIVSKDIQLSLKNLGYNVVGAAATGEKALELASMENPDIILMDIMLKGSMTGIDVAEEIKASMNIPVIYLTAYSDEATVGKAKHTEPYGYVIKPFREVDLQTTIEMALHNHKKSRQLEKERDLLYSIVENKEKENQSEFIFVKSNSKLVKLNKKEIYYIEALKDYVVINTPDNRYTIHSTMKDIENKLGNQDFLRVHRSYIVRVDKLSTIDYPNLQLENIKKEIPIGGSYKDELTNRIKLF